MLPIIDVSVNTPAGSRVDHGVDGALEWGATGIAGGALLGGATGGLAGLRTGLQIRSAGKAIDSFPFTGRLGDIAGKITKIAPVVGTAAGGAIGSVRGAAAVGVTGAVAGAIYGVVADRS